MRCADTPTQASPERTISSTVFTHCGLASTPPVTFSHSTITVPLKPVLRRGARTTTRVRYGASSTAAKFQRPSEAKPPSARYDVAFPSATYSRCT
jgi:hypothetical protein